MTTKKKSKTQQNKSKNYPLAIVGIGCRFPGHVSSPEEFWDLLCRGEDAIAPIPSTRWSIQKYFDADLKKPGKSYAKEAGFIDQDIELFDPEFFSISPREAQVMDPQQRLLLEVAWEAIENSGMPLAEFQEKKTGVFVGGFCLDSKLIQLNPLNRENINSFTSAGITMCVLSNRISHALNLTGPSLSVDTACSSSLVATHLACRNIWANDCDIALVGGINVMMHPEYFVSMCKGRFLSPSMRCMAFDSRADGYVRGEGCGIVVIKPLADAEANGDRIYAIINETGVNQDGRTAGISLPNSQAQEALIQKVYSSAGIDPNDVVYVEAHGTGTQQGDYAEAMALHQIFKHNRQKCVIGSVKTNIGHLEAAAGVAGLIKAALCLYNGAIPANLHFKNPNEKIPFDELKIRVAQQFEKINRSSAEIYMGVNSFGYGGTNAHVLLSKSDAAESNAMIKAKKLSWPIIYPLSARSMEALDALTKKHYDLLRVVGSEDENKLFDILFSLVFRRTHLDYRQAIYAKNFSSLISILSQKDFSKDPAIIRGKVSSKRNHIIFVFTGMGPQWYGMGKWLFENNSMFSSVIKKCDLLFKAYSSISIIEELSRDEMHSRVQQANIAQPLNFAVQIALVEMLKEWGVQPDCVVGHSVGEISAAYVAGALSLEEALLVSYHRSRLQHSVAGQGGGMLAANISEDEAKEIIKEYSDISIAAVNSSHDVTFSGDRDTLLVVGEKLTGQGIFNSMLKVDIAYHSKQMNLFQDELLRSLSSLKPRPTDLNLYSTVTGELIDGKQLNNEYWWQNVRMPVLFSKAIDSLASDEFNLFIEIGPHPVTKNYLHDAISRLNISGRVLASLHRKTMEEEAFLTLLCHLYVSGCHINWQHILSDLDGCFVDLPTYPWQRERYWLENDKTVSIRQVESDYPFLSKRVEFYNPSWEVELNTQFFPFLPDHRVYKHIVFPGTGFIEAAIEVNFSQTKQVACCLGDIELSKMLVFEEEAIQNLFIEYQAKEKSIFVRSNKNATSEWETHFSAKLCDASTMLAQKNNLHLIQSRCHNEIPAGLIYELFKKQGLIYGRSFQLVRQVWYSEKSNEILSFVQPLDEFASSTFFIHPALLDATFHSLMAMDEELTDVEPYLPVKIRQFKFYRSATGSVWVHAKITEKTPTKITEDLSIYDENGNLIIEINGFTCQRLAEEVSRSTLNLADVIYDIKWVPYPFQHKPIFYHHGTVVLFAEKQNVLVNKIIRELSYFSVEILVILNQTKSVQHDESCPAKVYHLPFSNQSEILEILDKVEQREFIFVFIPEIEVIEDPLEPHAYQELLKHCVHATSLSKIIDALNFNLLQFVIVTEQAFSIEVNDDCEHVLLSSLAGLSFLLNNLKDTLSCKIVDVEKNSSDEQIEQLASEIFSKNGQTDIALRASGRYVFSIEKNKQFIEQRGGLYQSTEESLMLENGEIFVPQQLKPLLAKEMTVKIEKIFLRSLTQKSDEMPQMIYGRVAEVGAGVNSYHVGELILAIIPYRAISTQCVIHVDHHIVAPVRDDLQTQPVGFIVPYLYAYLGIIAINKIEQGSYVIVEYADNALGYAFISLAALRGLQTIVIARTEQDCERLITVGASHVIVEDSQELLTKIRNLLHDNKVKSVIRILSSRDYSYYGSILDSVSYVVNVHQLSDELTRYPIDGKNISVVNVNINHAVKMGDETLKSVFQNVLTLIQSKQLLPIPFVQISAADLSYAFQHSLTVDEYQCVEINLHNQTVLVEDRRDKIKHFETQATYLITGGTSGFGLELAKWLALKGAKNIILISRRGLSTDYAKHVVKVIQAHGTNVVVAKLDISQKESLSSLINSIDNVHLPLKGVFHCATVLDDGLITDMTLSRYETLFQAKVLGAINLHELTHHLDLRYFVMTSSLSSLVGNVSQANYVAANAFLDAFVSYRKNHHLPATTLNIGILDEVGLIARSDVLGKYVDYLSIKRTKVRDVIALLEAMLATDIAHLGIFDLKWDKWKKNNLLASASSRFNEAIEAALTSDGEQSSNGINLLQMLGDTEEESIAVLIALVSEVLGKILHMASDKVSEDQSLNSLGVDSLMVAELRNTLISQFDVAISLVDLLKGVTVKELAKLILKELQAN